MSPQSCSAVSAHAQENTPELRDQIKSIRVIYCKVLPGFCKLPRCLSASVSSSASSCRAMLESLWDHATPTTTGGNWTSGRARISVDFIPFPQLFSMHQLGFLLNQQNQRELEQR